MKKLLMMTALSCAFAAQTTLPAFADATAGQKQQMEQTRSAMGEAFKTDEGCQAVCEEVMKNEKSKKMMCEMMAKDPEAMKMMKGH